MNWHIPPTPPFPERDIQEIANRVATNDPKAYLLMGWFSSQATFWLHVLQTERHQRMGRFYERSDN